MDEALKASVMDYLNTHHTMRLATVTADGQPMVHTVEYIVDGPVIYFITNNNSRKTVNIAGNSRIAIAIDEFAEDWNTIKGLQLEGKATLVGDQGEIEKVLGLFAAKFPQMKDMKPDPNMALYKIEITHGFMLDYTKGFGHRDEIVV